MGRYRKLGPTGAATILISNGLTLSKRVFLSREGACPFVRKHKDELAMSLLNSLYYEEHVVVWRRHFSFYDTGIDCDGRTIKFAEYGKYSECGWQIDHTMPTALGGLDAYANKRPRHWRGNSSAGGLLGSLLNR